MLEQGHADGDAMNGDDDASEVPHQHIGEYFKEESLRLRIYYLLLWAGENAGLEVLYFTTLDNTCNRESQLREDEDTKEDAHFAASIE